MRPSLLMSQVLSKMSEFVRQSVRAFDVNRNRPPKYVQYLPTLVLHNQQGQPVAHEGLDGTVEALRSIEATLSQFHLDLRHFLQATQSTIVSKRSAPSNPTPAGPRPSQPPSQMQATRFQRPSPDLVNKNFEDTTISMPARAGRPDEDWDEDNVFTSAEPGPNVMTQTNS